MYPETIITLGVGVGVFTLTSTIIIIGTAKSRNLTQKINDKKKHLSELEEELKNNRAMQPTKLSKEENEILDIYENAGIRIPVDILEDLQNMKLTNTKDIFNFIEIQRRYWKLENMKKPFRKEVE
jgi:hypothetical protein